MSHRVPVTARIGLSIAAPPRVAPLPGPRFPVGTTVRVLAGHAGPVVDAHGDERRVRVRRGSLEWHHVDQLVGVRR